MNRLTEPLGINKDFCPSGDLCTEIEVWVKNHTGQYLDYNGHSGCFDCPMLKVFRKLAEYEDEETIKNEDIHG